MIVDLRSDTVTKPCPEMRKTMANAEVGDDVLGDDPTVIALEERIADLIGTDSAIFVPSGTMSNQVAIWLNTKRGDAIAVEQNAHIYHYEAGSPAILSSVMMRCIQGQSGIMDLASLRNAFPPLDPHFAPTTLICVEDTANRGGGTIYPMETLKAITSLAKSNGAKSHLDGARLFNAQASSGHSARQRAVGFDTVSICFSKGLGAPVGSALCLPADRVNEAKRARKAFGGGMRQSGILAAAALYALDHNIDRLSEDHHNCQLLAKGLAEAGYQVRPPTSNMAYFEAKDAAKLVDTVRAEGIWALALGPTTIRVVTHLQVDRTGIERAIQAFSTHSLEHI